MTEPNTPRRFLYGTSSCKNATLVWTNLVSLHVYVHETFVPHVTPPPAAPPLPCASPRPAAYLCLCFIRDCFVCFTRASLGSPTTLGPCAPSCSRCKTRLAGRSSPGSPGSVPCTRLCPVGHPIDRRSAHSVWSGSRWRFPSDRFLKVAGERGMVNRVGEI